MGSWWGSCRYTRSKYNSRTVTVTSKTIGVFCLLYNMLLELPLEIQEIIYKKLDGKSRCRVRTCLSAKHNFGFCCTEEDTKTAKWKVTNKEKQLAVVEGYINKHRNALMQKRKLLPVAIHSFMMYEVRGRGGDSYVYAMLQDVGVENGIDYEDMHLYAFKRRIQEHKLTPKYLQEMLAKHINFAESAQRSAFLETVASHANLDTFTMLLDNEVTRNVIIDATHRVEDSVNWFAFNLVGNTNEQLVAYIFRDGENRFNTADMIREITCPSFAKVFCKTFTASPLALLIKHFGAHFELDVLEDLLGESEEGLYYECALCLSKYIEERKRVTL